VQHHQRLAPAQFLEVKLHQFSCYNSENPLAFALLAERGLGVLFSGKFFKSQQLT
jgi:hypothetical protein